MTPIRVILVDDRAITRAALKVFLNAAPDLAVVGEATGDEGAIEGAGRLPADIVIVHAHTLCAGELETIKRIVRGRSEAKVMVLTPRLCPRSLVRAIAAGAGRVLVYPGLDPKNMGNGIRDLVFAPSAVALASEDRGMGDRGSSDQMSLSHFLTPREAQIFRMIGDGRNNREIAGSLGIRLKTVKNHINHIYAKLSSDCIRKRSSHLWALGQARSGIAWQTRHEGPGRKSAEARLLHMDS